MPLWALFSPAVSNSDICPSKFCFAKFRRVFVSLEILFDLPAFSLILVIVLQNKAADFEEDKTKTPLTSYGSYIAKRI